MRESVHNLYMHIKAKCFPVLNSQSVVLLSRGRRDIHIAR